MQTLNDFQKIMGGSDSNWLQPTIRLTTQELSNLFQDLDLNSPKRSTAKAERVNSGRTETSRCICG